MRLNGTAVFIEKRSFDRKDSNDKMHFAVFGFAEDFDRRDVAVPEELYAKLPAAPNAKVKVTFDINRRYDGKEDIKLVEIAAI